VNQVFLRIFNAFANRVWNFGSFTDTSAYVAFAVADNNESAEAEPTSAFYYFRYAVDVDNFFSQF
jgi:hypothetical protein